tara:strand:+ start:2891 stop:3772 length:882 start_codon:yes stop_codon:yes gene_type:complete
MNKYTKILRFNNLFKNLLIIAPLIAYGSFDIKKDIILFLEGFVALSLINLLCYLINDYTDQKIDKNNKLKKKIKINKNELFILCILLIGLIILSLLYLKLYENIYVYLYLINFFLYNFITKKIIILDLIFLNNFYIIRILYGATLFKLDISIGFLTFFISLFMALSLAKRVPQIQINQLKKNNSILKYSVEDINKFISFIFLFFSTSILIFFLYLLNSCCVNFNNYNLFQISNYSIETLIVLFSLFVIWVIRTIILLVKNKIKIDIYKFYLQDKFSYFILTIFLIYLTAKNAI